MIGVIAFVLIMIGYTKMNKEELIKALDEK